MHLVEQLEVGAIGGGAELLNLLQAARLLGAEVVAGEAEYGKTLGAVAVLQGLQTGVLAGEATTAGHIHNQQHLASPVAQFALAALGVAHCHVAHVDGHGEEKLLP